MAMKLFEHSLSRSIFNQSDSQTRKFLSEEITTNDTDFSVIPRTLLGTADFRTPNEKLESELVTRFYTTPD